MPSGCLGQVDPPTGQVTFHCPMGKGLASHLPTYGLFKWKWEGGYPIYPYNFSFFLDRIHMSGGVPHQGGLPKLACLGNPLRWGKFSPCESSGSGVTRLTGVIKSLEHGDLFRRFHLQNCHNTDEIDSAGNNLGVELDSQANQLNQTIVLPATTTLKRKAASSEQMIVLCLCACLATK